MTGSKWALESKAQKKHTTETSPFVGERLDGQPAGLSRFFGRGVPGGLLLRNDRERLDRRRDRLTDRRTQPLKTIVGGGGSAAPTSRVPSFAGLGTAQRRLPRRRGWLSVVMGCAGRICRTGAEHGVALGRGAGSGPHISCTSPRRQRPSRHGTSAPRGGPQTRSGKHTAVQSDTRRRWCPRARSRTRTCADAVSRRRRRTHSDAPKVNLASS